MSNFSVVMVELEAGERMPLLCDAQSGLGLFEPTAYALYLRSRGRAVNTLGQALRAVQLLYQVLSARGIDLLERVRHNELLTLGEVETLVEQCKLKKHDLDELHHGPSEGEPIRLDIARLRKGDRKLARLPTVDSNSSIVRLKYIEQYLRWFAEYAYLQKLPQNRELFRDVASRTADAIGSRIPSARKRNASTRKRGLTEKHEAALLKLVRPDAPSNPWPESFLRERNYLIVRMLLGLGVRKGELLGIKVQDINLARSTVFIARRADDPEDPRHIHPATKTFDRELLAGAELMAQLKGYLVQRSKLPLAKKNPYLIVNERGAPLSLNSVDYMFATLRTHLPDIKQLSAHILRHTWNDRFSDLVEGKLSPEEEKKVRNYIMGWSEDSRSAENYTVRYVEQQAHTALTVMQKKMFRTA